MIQLQGPWPAPSILSILPNPQFSDVEKREQTITKSRSMNGTLYTYGNDTGVTQLTYTFSLTRAKSMELQRFMEVMLGHKMLLTNHKSENWIVTVQNNPFEIAQGRRGVGPTGREIDSVTIIFEGIPL
jgi:hypothetical protein